MLRTPAFESKKQAEADVIADLTEWSGWANDGSATVADVERAVIRPKLYDGFCGLGGWAEGFIAEGWEVTGFDIEAHEYGDQKYPGKLILRDMLTIHGSELADADCLVMSPPCTEFSYMAMPFSRGKRIAKALRGQGEFPEPYTGSRTIPELTALFDACFRIQREACEAAGRHIPMVVENVKGAQPWVGKSKANYGSFHLWGDVDMVGDRIIAGGLRWESVRAAKRGVKIGGAAGDDWFTHHNRDEFLNRIAAGYKGIDPIGDGEKPNGTGGTSWFFKQRADPRDIRGTKQEGSGAVWFDTGITQHSSRSEARRAASAQIAKIPRPLSEYIARSFKPCR